MFAFKHRRAYNVIYTIPRVKYCHQINLNPELSMNDRNCQLTRQSADETGCHRDTAQVDPFNSSGIESKSPALRQNRSQVERESCVVYTCYAA